MEFELYNENTSIIKVIGVGGGGSNAVNHMFRQGIKGVEFVICNTDGQALQMSPIPHKIQLGMSLTEGRGAGANPEIGRSAAIENIEEVRKVLSNNTKMVFITAGMGGGTGTGAAPIIAQVARELGILTVGIVTIPFQFEGPKRKQQANNGIEELKKQVDTLLIISNDKLRLMYGDLRLSQAFGHADDILTIAAKGIAEIITVVGYVNVDFEDVKTVMTNSGRAIMGSGVAGGNDRATKAVELALASPLLNDDNIKGARYILMNITSGTSEVTMDEIGAITDYVQEAAGLSADIIWGNCKDESLEENLSVTIIATGFKTKDELGKEAEQKKIYIDLNSGRELLQPEFKEQSKVSSISSEDSVTDSLEPVLIKSEISSTPKASQAEDELTFEFNIGEANSLEPTLKKDEPELKIGKTVLPVNHEQRADDLIDDEVQQRSNERVMKLKQLSYKIGNNSTINEMERIPAYLRQQIKLQNVPHSSEENLSRYTVTNDEKKGPELRPNNSFLNDKVD